MYNHNALCHRLICQYKNKLGDSFHFAEFPFSMGSSRKQSANPTSTPSPQNSEGWDCVHPGEGGSPIRENTSSPPPPPTSPAAPTPREEMEWELPLPSIVLENHVHDVPLNLLYVYGAILEKFRCAPCDALGQAISYLQALFTESPGFHPHITHMPSNSLPSNPSFRRNVAEALERKLIRVVQHLFPFFNGNVPCVVNYISKCPAELIPKPLFIVSDHPSNSDSSSSHLKSLPHGVQGFNNGVSGGAQVWSSPSRPLRPEDEAVLRMNLDRCAAEINRRPGVHPSFLPPRYPQASPRSNPSRRSPAGQQPEPSSFNLPARQLPVFPPAQWMQGPPGSLFVGPNPVQSSGPLVQPNTLPVRLPPIAANAQGGSSVLSTEQVLRNDISRLEAQVMNLTQLVNTKFLLQGSQGI
jgi:hypothetical protein